MLAHFNMVRRRAASVANGEEATWRWLAKDTIMTRMTPTGHGPLIYAVMHKPHSFGTLC
jgi:hypothetical protein